MDRLWTIIVLITIFCILSLSITYYDNTISDGTIIDIDEEESILRKKPVCHNREIFYFRFVKDFNLERDYNQNITRIAFGSCNYQYKEAEIFKQIVSFEPDLWIWLGDMMYIDQGEVYEETEEITQKTLKQQYNILEKNKAITEFRMYDIPTTGVWDDHDYYKDNAGCDADPSITKLSKKYFLDFLNVSKKDIRYKRKGNYSSYELKSPCKKYSVKIFLLDVRSFRTSMDILGRKQWKWLVNGLKKSCADINILASGSQILSNRSNNESWNGAVSRHKIVNMLKSIKKFNTIFISGDPHYSSIVNYDGFIDVTSSSLSSGLREPEHLDPGLIGYSLSRHNFGFIHIEWSENRKHNIVVGFVDDSNRSHNVIQLVGRN